MDESATNGGPTIAVLDETGGESTAAAVTGRSLDLPCCNVYP